MRGSVWPCQQSQQIPPPYSECKLGTILVDKGHVHGNILLPTQMQACLFKHITGMPTHLTPMLLVSGLVNGADYQDATGTFAIFMTLPGFFVHNSRSLVGNLVLVTVSDLVWGMPIGFQIM